MTTCDAKWTPEGYPENDIGCLSGPKKT